MSNLNNFYLKCIYLFNQIYGTIATVMGFSKSGIFDAFTYKNNFLKYILNHRKTKESQRMDYLKLKKIYNKVDTKSLN